MYIKPRTYARAAAPDRSDGEDAQLGDQQTLKMQVINFLKSKNIHLDANNVSACHTLPRKECKFKPATIIRT